MADLPISGLPTVTSLDGTELLPFVQGGVTTQGNVQDILNANLPLTSSGLLIGGNIIPSVSKSFSLGSTAFPFKDIHISSGSLFISSDIPGAPSTIFSNVDGNILISAGGMQLVSSGSFNATTGSFQYITGSVKHVGINTFSGSLNVSGSVDIKGITTYGGAVIYAQSSSIQYLPRVVPDSSPTSSITLDFSKDTLVHVHCTGFSTFTVNCTNFTTGSIVELYLTNNAGTTQVNMPGSINSNNLIGKNGVGSFWSMSRPSGYFKFTCIDGTAANTFVIGSVN
jgi:hypothetical protein